MSMIVPPVAFLLGVALLLGLATRYAALVCVAFMLATALIALRYWEFPAAQFSNFFKNMSIIGGALLLFVTGPVLARQLADRTKIEARATSSSSLPDLIRQFIFYAKG
jgi:uncharacterized membrane protein YphA (DoxX/SURF4 family)